MHTINLGKSETHMYLTKKSIYMYMYYEQKMNAVLVNNSLINDLMNNVGVPIDNYFNLTGCCIHF